MAIKLGRSYLFILAIFTFLWTQQTNTIAQKIAIENSYQQKISTAIYNFNAKAKSKLSKAKSKLRKGKSKLSKS